MTADPDFDAAEELVRQAVECFERSRYLAPGVAEAFVESLAFRYWRHDARVLLVSTIPGQPQWIWPPDLSGDDRRRAVITLFTEVGVATASHDALRFVSDSVCHYLALTEVGDLPHRPAAAAELGERDRGQGATAFLTIAAAGARKEPKPLDLLRAAHVLDPERTTATLVDQTQADKIFADLARTAKIGLVRVRAALQLSPSEDVVRILDEIVCQLGGHEDVQRAAAEEAVKYDEEQARWRLSHVQPNLSPRTGAFVADLLRRAGR
ncbi:hypothetical protein [Actinophytocola sp.]|uniref:hypothetical protein n=1 Tax=Actinophytocola sp. TaxID=1872138 RepID=UPI003899DBA4